MPYYIYRIAETPIRRLEKLGQHDSFKEAGTAAKALRAAAGVPAGASVKVIFAENELQAEDLLSQLRVPPLKVGDDI